MPYEEVLTPMDVSLSGLGYPSLPKGAVPLDFEFLTSAPQIRFEELSRISFPAILPPLSLPTSERKKAELAPEVRALLAPVPWRPVDCVPPVAAAPRKRRRWPKIFFAAILGAATGWALIQTPLGRDPRVRPYAEIANAKVTQGWVVAKAGTVRGAAWTKATWNAYVR